MCVVTKRKSTLIRFHSLGDSIYLHCTSSADKLMNVASHLRQADKRPGRGRVRGGGGGGDEPGKVYRWGQHYLHDANFLQRLLMTVGIDHICHHSYCCCGWLHC